MKQIIKGKLYDTATAKRIAEDSKHSPRDFAYYCETLYRKRTGEYFIYGEGGPASKYAEVVDTNCWSGGSRILPMPFDKAKEWAEEHMTADAYMEEFGEVAEDDSRVTMSISLDAGTAERIRRAAQEAGTSVSGIIASKF